ncbi:helix-hairpin-helix domain-containing protein [Brockia lithotrophica]|uniref:Competence protein ComEA n=1 Tax=Brockia lithotrophica TaxID=933949 RepID=A0A660L4V5_9BACL|nr:helix-hairpin-helix domain-containing protein [Brockia lithotrophica]RKQ88967.1 competence protein ComEA [Brockia lithotrophica]
MKHRLREALYRFLREYAPYLLPVALLVAVGIAYPLLRSHLGAREVASPASAAEAAYAEAAPTRERASREAAAPAKPAVLVDIRGAVREPGVYAFWESDVRVYQAVERAGGFTEDADLERVNRAAPLRDGQILHIPRIGEPVSGEDARALPGPSAGGGRSEQLRVNLNTAGVEELMRLPGIGPTRAQDIVAYREEHGPFRSVDEVQNVAGIGPKTFAKIRPYLVVEP